MRARKMFAACFVAGLAAFSAQTHGDEPAAAAAPSAREVFEQLENATDWRDVQKHSDQLATMGAEAREIVRREAVRHGDAKIRKACYEILIKAFADDELVQRTMVNSGLADTDAGIRYYCAFEVGRLKIYPAFRRLRVLLKNEEHDSWIHYAAAKSLAELGEAEALPVLYDGLGNDRYMPRYMASLGIKALTGKDLSEFGYEYGEGAYVSGGNEAMTPRRPIDDAERKAKRFGAIAAYCKWLKCEHPELYKHLDHGF